MARRIPISNRFVELMLNYVEQRDRYPEEFSQDETSITDEEVFPESGYPL